MKIPVLAIVWLWIILVIGSTVGVTCLVSTSVVKPESYNNVRELREAIRLCMEADDMHPVIETVWNAPVGQPRKPIEWRVTCRK